MPDELTYEQLQAEYLSLKEQNEKLTSDLETSNNSLSEARKLNSKLIHNIPVIKDNQPQPTEEESHPETREEFIDSFVVDSVKRLKSVYGDNCL